MKEEPDKIILQLKVEMEVLKTLLISRGKINAIEFQEVKDRMLKSYEENHAILDA